MLRKPLKIADISQSLPDVFKSLRANEAIIWMENHHLKYKIAGDDTIYDASGITIIDSNNKKLPVTPDTVFKLTGNHIKSTEVTKTGNIVALDIQLNLTGEKLLDLIPAASDTHFGVIKLSNNSVGTNKRISATEWLANYSRITVEEHSKIKIIHSTKPTTPAIGDAYYDTSSATTKIYNTFTQPARIVGTYAAGAKQIAIIGATDAFRKLLSGNFVKLTGDTYEYTLTKTTVASPDSFLEEHGVSTEYTEIAEFYNIATHTGAGISKVHGDDDILTITTWDECIISVKSILDADKSNADAIEQAKKDFDKKITDLRDELSKQDRTIEVLQNVINVSRWQNLSGTDEQFVVDPDKVDETLQKISDESKWQSI